MRTKQDALQIVNRLKEEYPLAECTLDYDSAWQLLVSVRLAAQCTDARVNIITEELFAKYPTLEALAAAGADNIEAIVRPLSLIHIWPGIPPFEPAACFSPARAYDRQVSQNAPRLLLPAQPAPQPVTGQSPVSAKAFLKSLLPGLWRPPGAMPEAKALYGGLHRHSRQAPTPSQALRHSRGPA